MEQLTVKEALEQGYKYYGDPGSDEVMTIDNDIEFQEDVDYFLFSKEKSHPSTDGHTLFEIISEYIRDNSDFYDEDEQTIVAINNSTVDWADIARQLNESLKQVSYYPPTKIKLIP